MFIYSPVVEYLDCFQFGTVINKAAVINKTFAYKSLHGHMLLCLLCKYQEVECLDHRVGMSLSFSESAKQVSKEVVHSY